MACGCIAIGYAGGGGAEYLLPDLSYPVPDGDIVAFARTVEQVLTEHARDPASLAEKARRASAFVLDRYSIAREEQTCIAAWQAIAGEPRGDGKAIGRAAGGLVWESQAPIKWQVRTGK
jgi:glycosyltransferase involved in cell wall biosynthesis